MEVMPNGENSCFNSLCEDHRSWLNSGELFSRNEKYNKPIKINCDRIFTYKSSREPGHTWDCFEVCAIYPWFYTVEGISWGSNGGDGHALTFHEIIWE